MERYVNEKFIVKGRSHGITSPHKLLPLKPLQLINEPPEPDSDRSDARITFMSIRDKNEEATKENKVVKKPAGTVTTRERVLSFDSCNRVAQLDLVAEVS